MSKPVAPVLQAGNALATNLVRCYVFTAADAAGTTIVDYSASAQNLTTRQAETMAALTWGVDGTQGEYLAFTGSASQDAKAADTGLPVGTAAKTFAFLLKGGVDGSYFFGYGTNGTNLLGLGMGATDPGHSPPGAFAVTTLASSLDNNTAINDGAWHVVHAVFNGSTVTLYTDGTAAAVYNLPGDTTSGSPPPWTNSLTSGGSMYLGQLGGTGSGVGDGSYGVNWTGQIAGMWAWSAALSSGQVTTHISDIWQMVRPAGATKLAVTTQPPGSTVSGSTFGLAVSAEDSTSTLVLGYTGNVTVAIGTNPGSGTLAGTLTVAAVAGVATFTGLSINNAGVGYTLTATASGLTSATSSTFTITSGTATAFTLVGPNSGFDHTASANFTFTPNANYTGTITPTMVGVAGAWSPTILTWSAASNAQTATFTPSAIGSGTANGNSSPSLTQPTNIPYTSNAQTLAVSPTTLMTSSTTVVTFTGGGTHYTVSAPTFTPTGVAGVTAGSVTVVNDTTATVSVTTGTAVGTVTWTDSTTSATATQAVSTAPVISTTTVLSVVQGFASGLNTVGYAVYNPDGTLYSAFTTAGVNERGTGSGNYGAVVTIPSPGTAEIRWSIGNAAPFAVDVETTAQISAIAPNGLDEVMLESGINARQGLALAMDAVCSLLSGATAAASTILVKDPTGAHARISANVDKFGNRSSVTLTPPA